MEYLKQFVALVGWQTISGFFFGLIAPFSIYFYVKNKLSKVRALVDVMDSAMADDKLTDAEFASIWEKAKDLVRK